jgi:hypothetical protein
MREGILFRRITFVSAFICACLCQVSGQVTFSKAPKKLQIYGRDLITDSAVVPIEGKVKRAGANYSEIRCRVFRDGVQRNMISALLSFTADSALFSLRPLIYAELASYRFEIYGYNGTQETLIQSIDSVACGDVFIITGQSNSVAWNLSENPSGSANSNQSPYIRVLGSGSYSGSDSTWRIGQGDGKETTQGNTGQWGLRLARLIVNNQKIPVAIFNGGHGGQPIQFFQRNDVNPTDPNTNYGRLLLRIRAAGLTNNIRAIMFHQGEANAYADGNALSLSAYKTAFQALMSDWQMDFPSIERIYIFQIRNGCNCPVDSVLNVKEAQRQFGQLPKVSVMSTSAETHFSDNCHFPYTNGYLSFGENMYRLLRRDLYGSSADNINAPNIKFAEVVNNGLTFKLIMEDIMDSITWVNGAQNDFKFTGATSGVTAGVCRGYSALLTLNSSGNGITGISYVGHQNTPDPMVTNLNGVGALHFRNFPITTPKYRDSISLAAILHANNITLPIDSFAVFNTNGRIIKLNLSKRKISKLHPYIGYMDSLNTIDLTGNQLTTLPREIIKISPANVMVNFNRMCVGTISDTIKTWINRHSIDVNWQTTQLSDSIHSCNGALAAEFRSSEEMAALGNSQRFVVSVHRKCLHLDIIKPQEVSSIKILKMNGSVVKHFNHASNIMKIDLSESSASTFILQIVRSNQLQVTKRILLF